MMHSFLIVVVIAAVNVCIRFLPFWIFSRGNKTPRLIEQLGELLPFAIMGMLVVYCLKDVSVISYPFGIPEAIAIILVAVLHIWKRNTLISISVGTICYMALVQLVFV